MSRRLPSVIAVAVLAAFTAVACARTPEARKAAHLQRGEKYYQQGKYNEAIIEYRNVLNLDAENLQAHYRLGLAYHAYSGDHDRSVRRILISRFRGS
jgi:tetratricopeptide (TPR) repeat protein